MLSALYVLARLCQTLSFATTAKDENEDVEDVECGSDGGDE